MVARGVQAKLYAPWKRKIIATVAYIPELLSVVPNTEGKSALDSPPYIVKQTLPLVRAPTANRKPVCETQLVKARGFRPILSERYVPASAANKQKTFRTTFCSMCKQVIYGAQLSGDVR